MDWLKDKKNQPIVAAILIVVLLVAGFCMYWFNFRSTGDATAMDQTVQTDPSAVAPTGTSAPTPGSMPGAAPVGGPVPAATSAPVGTVPTAAASPAPGAAGKVQVASIKPMETWRGDPFEPIGYKPIKKGRVTLPIWDFPFEPLPGRSKGTVGGKKERAEIQQPSRRMAGILLNDRIYAIIESNGVSQVVQPGDYTTPDRLAIVERIEPDKVILKTVDSKPRYITVTMAASPLVPQTTPTTNMNQGPMGPGMPGMPSMPGMPMPGMRSRVPRGGR